MIIGKRNIKSITSWGVLGYPSTHPFEIELSLLRKTSTKTFIPFREVEQNSFSNKLK